MQLLRLSMLSFRFVLITVTQCLYNLPKSSTSFGVTAWTRVTAWTCMCELPRCTVHWTRISIHWILDFKQLLLLLLLLLFRGYRQFQNKLPTFNKTATSLWHLYECGIGHAQWPCQTNVSYNLEDISHTLGLH